VRLRATIRPEPETSLAGEGAASAASFCPGISGDSLFQALHYQPEGEDMIGAIILGIVAGYVGRLLMPGRDKMGFLATMVMGLAGAVVGFLIFTELLGIGDNEMFDLGGLIGAVIGVMLLLVLYRALLKDKEHPLVR
jgi:uncharacterized membrane protein YeaQ/YmgE (transglycosylase-associated protein family)